MINIYILYFGTLLSRLSNDCLESDSDHQSSYEDVSMHKHISTLDLKTQLKAIEQQTKGEREVNEGTQKDTSEMMRERMQRYSKHETQPSHVNSKNDVKDEKGRFWKFIL